MRVHGAGGQPVEMGPDGLIGLISTWRAAFPDGHMSVEGLVAEGDLVAALLTWRGTQRGDFYGIPASKKRVACTSIGIDRVAGGIVRDGWGELDMVGLMQTVGALPLVGPGAVASGRSPEWGSERGDPIGWGPSSDNKAVGKRFIASWNTPVAGPFLDLVDTRRYREFNPVFGVEDAMGALKLLASLRAAMPDLCFTQDESMVISDGDIVVVHSVASGTHTGQPLFGAPAKGNKVVWTQTDWLRVSAGRVVARWVSADTLALLQQGGVLPAAG
jgi:predicted ester cyclase